MRVEGSENNEIDVESGVWVILLAVFASLSVVFFLFAWLVNPGYMKNKKTTDILVKKMMILRG